MSVREYIGARYVPLFASPIDWNSANAYEPLTVVYYQGNSYTSRQAVPAGIEITNVTYWALTGNYNAQIEQYRSEVQNFDARISDNTTAISDEITDRTQAITDEAATRASADSALQTAISDEAATRASDDSALAQELSQKIKSSIKEISWNCRFRQIFGTNYDLSVSKSAQGMTIFEISEKRILAQAVVLDASTYGIILYDYDNSTEITRITSASYGHINDLTYRNGNLYALAEATSTIHTFNVTATTISYISSENIPVTTAALDKGTDNTWFTATNKGSALGITLSQYNNDFSDILKNYQIPFAGNAIIQGLSVREDDVFIALTMPNTIIHFNLKDNTHYYINPPKYIGHCFNDEIEGVFFDASGYIYFNTNSTVDMQALTTVFETNIYNNIEKEIDSSVSQNRYGQITAKIDAINGSLTAPTELGNSFKLAGDALNYAKALGNYDIDLIFVEDYPYPIVASNCNFTLASEKTSGNLNLNGIYARFCNVNLKNPTVTIFNPVDIPSFTFNNVVYGAYFTNCMFTIYSGTLASPSDQYSDTRKRAFFYNSEVLIQEMAYFRFFNCLVKNTDATLVATSIYERTGIVPHAS